MDEPEVKTDNDIIVRLESLQDPIRIALADARFELIMNRKEIEWLKSLITEWADSLDDGGVIYHDISDQYADARDALRKVIGR